MDPSISVSVYLSICLSIYTHTYIYIYISICMFIHVYVYIYIYISTVHTSRYRCLCVYIYASTVSGKDAHVLASDGHGQVGRCCAHQQPKSLENIITIQVFGLISKPHVTFVVHPMPVKLATSFFNVSHARQQENQPWVGNCSKWPSASAAIWPRSVPNFGGASTYFGSDDFRLTAKLPTQRGSTSVVSSHEAV